MKCEMHMLRYEIKKLLKVDFAKILKNKGFNSLLNFFHSLYQL